MRPRVSGGHLQKHLLLMFHNRHDGDEMRASPGTVLLFYGTICIVDATGSLGPSGTCSLYHLIWLCCTQ